MLLLLRPRFFTFCLAATLLLNGCQTPAEKAAAKAKKQEKEDAVYKIRDDNKDVSFQAFLGRLRKAVAAHDVPTMSSLMSDNFAYSWAPGGEGYGCFKFWDENNLWPELEAVIREDFVPYNGFLVAPREFAEMGQEYGGYRAGVQRVKGSFKFVYFVPPPDSEAPAAPPPTN